MPEARAIRAAGAAPNGRAAALQATSGAVLPVACATCLVAGAAYLAAVDPSEGGGLAACPVRAATGCWCPGCGLTRAMHQLLRGDVVQALSYNLLAPAVVLAVALGWWTWLRMATGRGTPRWVTMLGPRSTAFAVVLVVAFVGAFVVLRNLPGGAWMRGG